MAMIGPAIANAAVRAGTPPVSCDSDSAIGVVTAFGAIEKVTCDLSARFGGGVLGGSIDRAR